MIKEEIGAAPGKYELHRGAIIVRDTRTTIQEVAAAFETLHARYDRRVSCEASIYRLDAALARDLERLSPGSPAHLSSQALAVLDRASAETAGHARLLMGGLVSGYEEQRIHVTCGRERLHVAGLGNGREDALYVASRTGFVLDVRVGGDERGIRAAGRLASASLLPGSGEKVAASGTTLETSVVAASMQPFDGVVLPGEAIVLRSQLVGSDETIAVVIRPALLDAPR